MPGILKESSTQRRLAVLLLRVPAGAENQRKGRVTLQTIPSTQVILTILIVKNLSQTMSCEHVGTGHARLASLLWSSPLRPSAPPPGSFAGRWSHTMFLDASRTNWTKAGHRNITPSHVSVLLDAIDITKYASIYLGQSRGLHL